MAKDMHRAYERGIKQMSMIDMASITGKQANMQENEQKVVSARDKFRFRSGIHSFIMLKHGRHTSKQDSCMDM